MSVNQSPSLSSIATDPLRNFKFQVDLRPPSGKAITMGFMTVSGLAMTIDVIPYREGGMNTTTQNMPGQASFNPLTLSHGVIVGETQDLQWIQQLFTVMQGSGTQAPGTNFRWLADISVLDHPVTTASDPVKALFRCYNAWPTSMAWSDLDAGANQLFITQMALVYEGFAVQIAPGPGTAEVPGFTS